MGRATSRLEAVLEPTISAIVPTLDEERALGPTLARLAEVGVDELIVVDGGSVDGTEGVARAHGARWVRARAGRGSQLDAGAEVAAGEVLWFVHADCRVPRGAAARIREVLARPGVVAGAFRRRHVGATRPVVRSGLALMDLRSRWTLHPYGDQALFLPARVFREVGGFRGLPLMEDLDLCVRLRRRGRIAIAPEAVEVSARRYDARPVRATLAMIAFPALFLAGVPPPALARLYGRPR